jgi:hypothetical protein
VKRYEKYGRSPNGIVKRCGKYRRKLEIRWKIWKKSKLNSEKIGHFTIQLTFLPYFPYLFTIQLISLPHFPNLITIQLTFIPCFPIIKIWKIQKKNVICKLTLCPTVRGITLHLKG